MKERNQAGRVNFYERLIESRNDGREKQKSAVKVVRGKDLPLETNPQGLMRWYLHPDISDTAIRNYLFYVQEIPAGSSSGKLVHPGEVIVFVWKGKGFTQLDDRRYEWKAGDLVTLPIRSKGITVQHFNVDPQITARLVVAEPNVVDSLGVDRGSRFEQIEPCMEYVKSKGL